MKPACYLIRSLALFGLLAAAGPMPAAAPDDLVALRGRALEMLAPLPDQMPGAENDTDALVGLGKKLYFEKRLSRDGTQSCF